VLLAAGADWDRKHEGKTALEWTKDCLRDPLFGVRDSGTWKLPPSWETFQRGPSRPKTPRLWKWPKSQQTPSNLRMCNFARNTGPSSEVGL
jgi:hypothetical protein